jgi:hypothetical protein
MAAPEGVVIRDIKEQPAAEEEASISSIGTAAYWQSILAKDDGAAVLF